MSRMTVIIGVAALLIGFGGLFATDVFPASCDAGVHLRCARDFFLAAVDEGAYPDWDPFPHGGKGALTFRFTGPLPYLIAGLFQLLGFSLAGAVKLTVLTSALVGMYGVQRWANALGAPSDAWILAAAFLVAGPILTFKIWYVFLFQLVCAILLFPLCLAGLAESLSPHPLAEKPLPQGEAHPEAQYPARNSTRRNGLLCATIAYGLICWTHPQSAMMVGYGASCWALFTWISRPTRERFSRSAVALLIMATIGILSAAPYLLPAVLTTRDAHFELEKDFLPGITTRFLTDPVLDSAGQSRSLAGIGAEFAAFLQNRVAERFPALGLRTDSDHPLPHPGNPFLFEIIRPWLAFSALLMLFPPLLGFLLSPGRWAVLLPYTVPGLLAFFMTTHWSATVWAHFPGSWSFQFPWRWLFPAQVLLAPCLFFWNTPASSSPWRYAVPLSFAPLLVMTLLFQFLCGSFAPSRMETVIRTASSSSMVLPAACPAPNTPQPPAGEFHDFTFFAGQGSLTLRGKGFAWARYDAIIASPGAELHIATHFDNLWQLTSDLGNIPLEVVASDGTMKARLPTGTAQYHLQRTSPPFRNLGWALIVFVFLTGLILHRRFPAE